MSASYGQLLLLAALLPSAALAQGAPSQGAPTQPAATPQGVANLAKQITPGQGLTSGDAARRAVSSSFDVRAGRDDVAASQAAISSAKAGYVPKLTGIGRYTRLSDIGPQSLAPGDVVFAPGATGQITITPDTPLIGVPLVLPSLVNNYTLQATLTIPLSDYFLRVAPSVSAAESSEAASEQNLSATSRNVDLNARTTYYTWVRARLQVGVAEAAVETARGHIDDVQKAFNVGSASKADVLRVQSSLSQAQLNLVRAQNASELAEYRLRTVLHDAGNAPLAIGEDVLAELPATDENLNELTQRALANRPELRALANNVDATRSRAQVQRAGYLPRLDLTGNATYANPNQRFFPQQDQWNSTWDVSVQLSWTPTDIFGTASSVRDSEARAAQLESQRESTADSVRVEVVSDWQAVKEARQSIETTTSALGTAEEAYRVRRALFQNGRATSLELTDSELDLTRARLDAINARIDLRVAKASLAKAVGGK